MMLQPLRVVLSISVNGWSAQNAVTIWTPALTGGIRDTQKNGDLIE